MVEDRDQTPAAKRLAESRLESWKEIAAYVQRDVSTAMRWERSEDLPVHRHRHRLRNSVYAYPSELDSWWAARKPAALAEPRSPWRRPIPAVAFGVLVILSLVTVGNGTYVGPAMAADGSEPTMRMVWSDKTTDLLGSPSPDGRYLSFTDWESGDLAVRDLENGENRRLTNEGNAYHTWAEGSRWSPDGAWIAYDWYIGETGWDQLRLIPSKGGEPRILYDSAAHKMYTAVAGFSPDGQEVLLKVWDDKTRGYYIGAVSVSDGELRLIRSVTGQDPKVSGFSPDGRYVLFTQGNENGDSDVLVVSSDGKLTIPVVDHPSYDRAIGWHPDGKRILFASDRTGRLAAWAVRVENGDPRGEPRMIAASLPANSSLGFTKEGVLFLGNPSSLNSTDIFLAEIDPESGKIAAQPAKLVRRFEGINGWPNFSRDGRLLAYVSARGTPATLRNRSNTLCILELQTGKTKEYPTDFERLYNPQWGPDNNEVIFVARGDGGQSGLHRMDIRTGRMAVLRTWRNDQPRSTLSHQVSPDGKILYYSQADSDQDTSQIVAHDLESGRERVLFTGVYSDWPKLALSPDGNRLAFLNRAEERVVRVMPAAGGEPREVYRFTHKGNHVIEIAWTADGRYLLVPTHNHAETAAKFSWSLWRVRVEDGHAEETITGLRQSNVSTHPDGRRIVFSSSGPTRQNSEVWVMEDFLPDADGDE